MLQYILALVVALMLVAGQSLWKHGVTVMHIDKHAALLKKLLVVGLNPYILLGLVIYGVATVLYIYVIGRFAYGSSYALIVSLSLIFASASAMVLFNEKLSAVNLCGVVVILLGVFLVLFKR